MKHAEIMGKTGRQCVYDGNRKFENWTNWEIFHLRRGIFIKVVKVLKNGIIN